MWFKKNDQQKHCHHDFYKEDNLSIHDKDSHQTKKSAKREIKIIKKVLFSNDKIANIMRRKFTKHKVFVLNMMSSPGSGKTSTLQKTLTIIMKHLKCAVIVGDICTTNDADRLANSGAKVIQINTDKFGGDCHLTASAINKVLENIDLEETELIIIENIGNLVCPAEFDLGEDTKIVMLSVTEGEDKPAKYPLMFRESNLVLLNKIDLLPYLDFDIKLAKHNIKSINPLVPIFEISAKTEEGFTPWINWLKTKVRLKLL